MPVGMCSMKLQAHRLHMTRPETGGHGWDAGDRGSSALDLPAVQHLLSMVLKTMIRHSKLKTATRKPYFGF